MVGLSAKQRDALDAYIALIGAHPGLFSNRHSRPIVRDRDALSAYAAEHDVVLGVAADTPFALLVVDLVESRLPDGVVHRHPYVRVVSRAQLDGGTNVVVVAVIADASLGRIGDIVLVEQERHAPGTREIELPRGFGTPGASGESNALRELEEETGYIGVRATFLGTTYTDSGLTDAKVSFYHVLVVGRGRESPETGEAIGAVHLVPRAELLRRIHLGEVRDGFTVQALTLYDQAGLG